MSQTEIEETSAKYPVKILRVHGFDDDPRVVEVAETQMRMQGITCQVFSEQHEFIEKLKLRPDICFVDYRPPYADSLNGNQLTKIITDAVPNSKVIMLSAYEDIKAILKFYNECGGWRWLTKTVKESEYIDKLIFTVQEAIVDIRKSLELRAELENYKTLIENRKKRIAQRDETNSNL